VHPVPSALCSARRTLFGADILPTLRLVPCALSLSTVYEFEINAINANWDLELDKPYIDGGSANNSWDMVSRPLLCSARSTSRHTQPLTVWVCAVLCCARVRVVVQLGVMQTAVYVDGPVNDPNGGPDKYWTVELALPHRMYVEQCFAARSPPRDGDLWRINFSRVEYSVMVVNGAYEKVPGAPQDNWTWQSQAAINMHLPERWGYMQFSTAPVNSTPVAQDPAWPQRMALAGLYDGEHMFSAVNGYFTADLSQLILPDWLLDGSCGTATPNISLPMPWTFSATVESQDHPQLPIGNIEADRLTWFGDVPPPQSILRSAV
jgi:hypothetical protein